MSGGPNGGRTAAGDDDRPAGATVHPALEAARQQAEIGVRIRAARTAAGVSREHLASTLRLLGRSTTMNTIVRWERTGSLRALDLKLVARVLGVSAAALLGLEGDVAASEADDVADPLARG